MFDDSRRADEDAVTAALENKLVLERIFSYLPLSDLKQCRLVRKTWNYDAASFIKNFRGCVCRIWEDNPCDDLLALAKVVCGMNLIPINGLEIELRDSGHSDCKPFGEDEHKLYEALLRLPLEHFRLSWDTDFSPLSCPAVNFVVDLLRRKIMEFSSLEFNRLPTEFLDYFGKVWAPWLPKLRVLDVGVTWALQSPTDFVLRIISGAPNLKTLKGSRLEKEFLEVVPEVKYSLLNTFSVNIKDDGAERTCLKVAAAGPALKCFCVEAPSEFHSQYMRSFFHVTEKLLSSSCKSLETFSIYTRLFPLSLLTFPPMINMRTINISTDDTTPHLLYVLRATDYPKLFPVLSDVIIHNNGVFDPSNPVPNPVTNPWVNVEPIEAVQFSNPSITVKTLEISAEFDLLTVVELSHIFPNVVNLKLWGEIGQPTQAAAFALHRDVWASWPELESLSVQEHRGTLTWNFDAEFLGINYEEVEILRQLDDESLEKVNIVPVRPSLLTLLRKIRN